MDDTTAVSAAKFEIKAIISLEKGISLGFKTINCGFFEIFYRRHSVRSSPEIRTSCAHHENRTGLTPPRATHHGQGLRTMLDIAHLREPALITEFESPSLVKGVNAEVRISSLKKKRTFLDTYFSDSNRLW